MTIPSRCTRPVFEATLFVPSLAISVISHVRLHRRVSPTESRAKAIYLLLLEELVEFEANARTLRGNFEDVEWKCVDTVIRLFQKFCPF